MTTQMEKRLQELINEYKICKERGHVASTNLIPEGWYRCKFCYIEFKMEKVLRERYVPDSFTTENSADQAKDPE